MTSTIRRAAIYARISKDDTGYAVGVTDQAKRCRELITQRGWETTGPGCDCEDCKRYAVPPDVYCDNDISASGKRKRPHYQRLLADIRDGRVDAIVAVHNDRLHRSPVELEEYINVCQPREVPTHFVKAGDFDLTTASGRMVARMLGAMARAEWERMVERQRSAKQRNRDAGLRSSGRRPFGYQFDARDHRGSQIPGVSRGLVIDEREAAAIRDAYTAILAGVGYNTIARRWTAAGLRTPLVGYRRDENGDLTDRAIGGRPWSGIEVKRLLMCGRNAGLVEHDAGDGRGPQVTGPARWEPIVTEDVWRAARHLMVSATAGNTISPGPAPRWWLKGTLICGVCGCRRFAVRTKNGVPGYHCASMLDDRTRPGAGWHLRRNAQMVEDFAEVALLDHEFGLLRRPDLVAAFNTVPAADMTALNARRAAITAEMTEWARAPGITPAQLAARNEMLTASLEDIDRQIAAALRPRALPEFGGTADPADVWGSLRAAGNVERMRAIANLVMRVKLLPAGRGRMSNPADTMQILPPDA